MKKKLILTAATMTMALATGLVVASNAFSGTSLADAKSGVSGSIAFSRSSGSFKALADNSASVSGVTSTFGNTYYLISNNDSDISETNYVASFSTNSEYISFSDSENGGADFEFQKLTGIQIESSISTQLCVYYSTDGVNFSNYELVSASASPVVHNFSLSRKYIRIGNYQNADVDLVSVNLLFECVSGGVEPSRSAFDEINSKMELATKSFASVIGDGVVPNSRSTGKPTRTTPEFDAEFPFIEYNKNRPLQFLNSQQQLDYIIYIINFIHEGLTNSSYGVDFEYGVTYYGTGFMSTITSLNEPIIAYGWDEPILKVRFTEEVDGFSVLTSWDYTYPQLGFYSLNILSSLRFVFDSNQSLSRIWVNYFFADSDWFNLAIGLFDFANEEYKSLLFANSGEADRMSTYNRGKEQILENVALLNSGEADVDHIPVCNSIELVQSRLGEDVTMADFNHSFRYTNKANPVEPEQYTHYYSEEVKEYFEEMYVENYAALYTHTLLTTFEDTTLVNVGNLMSDGGVFAFWKSKFVYDYVIADVCLPFMEYSSMVGALSSLIAQTSGDTKSELEAMLAIVMASEGKYVGNDFSDSDHLYQYDIDSSDITRFNSNNDIAFYCYNGFSYVLKIDGAEILKFTYDGSTATIVA